KLQYKDYSEWQNSEERQLIIKQQEDFWIRKFEKEIPVLNLPFDYVRPAIQTYEGATVNFALSKEETQKIKSLSNEKGLTLYMTILSVYTILLSKLSRQEDIIVGTPTAGRNHVDLKRIVGVFINTLAIRNDLKGDKTLINYLQEIKRTTLEVFENQDYQFEDLVEQVSVERDMSRNPVFDVMFNLLNQTEQTSDLSGLDRNLYVHKPSISKFDLTLSGVDYGNQLMLNFEYNTKLFKAQTIERYIGYFKQIINHLPESLEKKLSSLEILSSEEKQQLLYEFNNTKADYPKNKLLVDLFEEQVKRNPDNIALVSGSESITYSELNKKSNQLANYLRGFGLVSENRIGMIIDRSVDMIIGIFGILKVGGVYVPIDPSYPEYRIKYILGNSNAKLILSQKIYIDKLNSKIPIVLHDNVDINNEEITNLNIKIRPNNLSYIIYTSGSTGNPKGVQIEHSSIVNLLYFLQETYPLNENDSYLLKTSYCFDVSVSELFGWILGGGKLAILKKDHEKDPDKIIEAINKFQITHINFVPTVLKSFSHSISSSEKNKIRSLKYILIAGEVLLKEHLHEINDLNLEAQIANLYGPTEATVYTSHYKLSSDEFGAIFIGKPISNYKIYIVDRNNQIQPIGVSGELLIGGEGLARGYLCNEELTAEKFIKNPLVEGERLYRTGDLARWLPDGNIEFMGRIDHQVKIRGFRIELGEIENALLKHSNIKECVVLAREENGEKYLCAYLLIKENYNEEEIRTYLLASLPDYMIPSYFVELEKLPLTSNGKINRKALPSPEIKAGEDYVAPSNETEEKLALIWSEILHVPYEKIGRNSNFFELGGHSLKLTLVLSKVHKKFNVKISFASAFKHSILFELAEFIKITVKDEFAIINNSEKQEFYPLTKAQIGIYLYQLMMPDSANYNLPMIISLSDDFKIDFLEEAFRSVIQRHECLRTSILVHNNEPFQRIHDTFDFTIPVYTASESNFNELTEEILKPFSLTNEPLIRACVLKLTNKQPSLIVNIHHIISDGFSLKLLEEDFNEITNKNYLAPLRYQYRDVAIWQKNPNFLKIQELHKKYWLEKFKVEIPELNLPTDYSRDLVESTEADRIKLLLTEEETYIIRELVISQKTTVFSVILSIFNIWLNKLTGDEDIIIGTPVSGRYHEDLNKICGIFVNTLALRNYPSGNKQFNRFLEETHRNVYNDFENQYYSFDELVSTICKERKVGRNPIFDVFYTFDNNQVVRAANVNEEVLTEEEVWQTGVKFDLFLSGFFIDDQIILNIDYKKSLFDRSSMENYVKILQEIIGQITKNQNILLDEIDLVKNVKINKNIVNTLNEDF
ncbi:MAG: amino acid adenylation domain-containing protein, partial [Bacteroidales bacterium]|nr:amino acid adenylation domain-containing protein [Bacteroidales bacterium]